MNYKNVYFCGASGCGKTTLAMRVASVYDLILVTNHSNTLRPMAGPADRDRFQADLLANTLRFLTAASASGGGVSDRCVDCLAYSALLGRGAPALAASVEWKSLLELIRRPSTAVFFVRPDRLVFETARASDNARRAAYLDWDQVNRIDGAIAALLGLCDIRFTEIHGSDLPGRWNAVRAILGEPKNRLAEASAKS